MSNADRMVYKFGPFKLDVERGILERDGDRIGLEPKALDVLSELVSNHGRVVGKDELMARVWPDCFVQESSISQNVHVLRRLLGDKRNGNRQYIVTVPGRGYKFIADVIESRRVAMVTEGGSDDSAPRSSNARVDGSGPRRSVEGGASQARVADKATADQDTVASMEEAAASVGERTLAGTLTRDADAIVGSGAEVQRAPGGTGGGRGWRGRTNLPIQPNPLIGRQQDIAAVTNMIRQESIRLITLTGPGGSGKTSLAIEAGKELFEDFDDGVWLVELAQLSDPSLILPSIAQNLGVREEGNTPVADCLKSYLESKRLLLILDNFEHLMAGELSIVDLAAHSGRLKVLITSRIVLKVRGEHEYHVEPLALPTPRRGRIDLEEICSFASVALFVERVRAVVPEFELTVENADAVSTICIRLDGLPLAIELAAPWIKVLSPAALAERLSADLNLLSDGARDLPARQRTIRATIEWSYGLLTDDEKTLFRRLAIFVGGFTLEAAEAVCGSVGLNAIDVLSLLSSLIDKNMVQRLSCSEDSVPNRAGMLETLREFGLKALVETGEDDLWRRRHAEFYCEFAEKSEPLMRGPALVRTLDLIETELGNLRAAIETAIRISNQDIGMRIGSSMAHFWRLRGSLAEGRQWLERLINLGVLTDSPVVAKAIRITASLVFQQGDYELGKDLCLAAMPICRASHSETEQAALLEILAAVCMAEGDYDLAIAHVDEALSIFRKYGNAWGVANAMIDLGSLLIHKGDPESASHLLEESLNLSREIEYEWGTMVGLNNSAVAYVKLGKLKEAADMLTSCLRILRNIGDQGMLANCFESLAELQFAIQGLEDVACFLGAANSVRSSAGLAIAPLLVPIRDEMLKAARAGLPAVDFEKAWRTGECMTIDEAIELIRRQELKLAPLRSDRFSLPTSEQGDV